MLCWGLTSGNAGMVAQVKALATTIGVEPVMKTVNIQKPFSWIPNIACASPLRHLVPHITVGDTLSPPYPDLVISCGRRAAMVAIGLRTRVAPATKFIHIQDPQVSSRYFDLVVAMGHDTITGANVIKTRFALHSITPEVLQQAAAQFAPRFVAYPKPHIAVLLGGSTNKYQLTKEAMESLIAALQQLLQTSEGSLLITPSRRTGEENIALLRKAFAGNGRVYLYDFIEPNPYMGLLALADTIIVTNDSVNMMSEAHATGKPVYILPLAGHMDTKPARFAEMLMKEGIARPLAGALEHWNYPAGDEMNQLAQQVKDFLR